MVKILANDGMDEAGIKALEKNGFVVDTNKIPQEELVKKLNDYDAVIVRSATKIRKEQIDESPNLKLVVRGGVGLDNIDVEYAKTKNVSVRNTPRSSSLSVAELVFAHLFSGARFLQQSNREMPLSGNTHFNDLKKKYAKGIELHGKTLGIIGFGNIGREVAKMAFGLGMDVLANDQFVPEAELKLDINNSEISITVKTVSKEEILLKSDFITLHTPGDQIILNDADFEKMKKGVGIINCARGGVFDENILLKYLNNGKIGFAGLDVFENEPTPNPELLKHPRVSVSPHVAASTDEAQTRVGLEIAEIITQFFKK
jgi:D-3-phosphoglycerate dehydrogenase / 2-oxoglutarate reductase